MAQQQKDNELTYKEHCEKTSDSKLTKKQQYDISSVINSLGALMFFEETTIEVAAQLGRSIVVLGKLMDEEEDDDVTK